MPTSVLPTSVLPTSVLPTSVVPTSVLPTSVVPTSVLPSLSFESDLRIRTQIAFHFASLIKNSINATDEEKEIYSKMLDYVNKFHRTDVERLTEIQ
jgi:hypothetical protein